MFSAIVPRYDLINRLMTLGLDRRWRRETAATIEPRGAIVLDIATGTGDLAFELIRQSARRVVGGDFSIEMLREAKRKSAEERDAERVQFVAADAMQLPFPDATFDAIVNGFMLRNVGNLPATFTELCRVLRPGGRLACLDLTPPRGPMRHFFSAYIATAVPALGILVGHHYGAYRYLFQSLSIHPDADAVAAMMRDAGFGKVEYKLTGFGTVAIHVGRKISADLSASPSI
jgi:demethylmenaquinone methyltransferase/2-methoxy-6-polyprenyl-1,4-benzoquinol methylase